jgi:hypothetical protein
MHSHQDKSAAKTALSNRRLNQWPLLFRTCRRGRGALRPLLDLAERAPSRQCKEKRHRKTAEARNRPGYQLEKPHYAARSDPSWQRWDT